MVVRSPGRINIIGEHTDYNEGFVLPAAIDKAIYVAIGKRHDDVISLYAGDFEQSHECYLQEVKPTEKHWPNYVLGVVDQLQKRGLVVGGFNLVVDGDIPIGAGLSSSAAVECAVAYALNEMFGLGLGRIEMVHLAQKAEHEFAGVRCGIMDQFASMMGKAGHAIKLDCRSLEYEYVPLDLRGAKIVLLNTNVKHSLASSEYNVRRQQCERGVTLIQQHVPEVHSLRDTTVDMLDAYVKQDAEVYNRCRYVVEEIGRLLLACEKLQQGHLEDLGKLMYATHDGLSRDYGVSCKELDYLVDAIRENPAVLGARMMGGGFGGCTINLVKEEAVDSLIANLGAAYEKDMKLPLTAYVATTQDGTGLM